MFNYPNFLLSSLNNILCFLSKGLGTVILIKNLKINLLSYLPIFYSNAACLNINDCKLLLNNFSRLK